MRSAIIPAILISALAPPAAQADSGCSAVFAWRSPSSQSQPACREATCASAGGLRRAPPKLPPWLMTRVAAGAQKSAACAVAAAAKQRSES